MTETPAQSAVRGRRADVEQVRDLLIAQDEALVRELPPEAATAAAAQLHLTRADRVAAIQDLPEPTVTGRTRHDLAAILTEVAMAMTTLTPAESVHGVLTRHGIDLPQLPARRQAAID